MIRLITCLVLGDDERFCFTADYPILQDIALLKLERPAVLSDYVNVICLDVDNSFPPGTPCVAAGWGQNKLGRETLIFQQAKLSF